jgi:hypothetical protein
VQKQNRIFGSHISPPLPFYYNTSFLKIKKIECISLKKDHACPGSSTFKKAIGRRSIQGLFEKRPLENL